MSTNERTPPNSLSAKNRFYCNNLIGIKMQLKFMFHVTFVVISTRHDTESLNRNGKWLSYVRDKMLESF